MIYTEPTRGLQPLDTENPPDPHGNLDAPVFGDGARPVEPAAEGEPLGELRPVDALPGHWKPFPPEGTEDILILHRQDLHDKNVKPRRAYFDGAWLYEDGAGQPFSIKANGGLLWRPAPPDEPPSSNCGSTRDAIERSQAAMARIQAVIRRLNPRTATDGEDAVARLAAYRLLRDAEVLEAAEGVANDPS